MFSREKPPSLVDETPKYFSIDTYPDVAPRGGSIEFAAIPFSPDWVTASAPVVPAPVASENSYGERSELPELAISLPVIVAEDDPVSRELVCTYLGRWGYDVIATQDGQEAMEAIRAQTEPALAVIDWMMPGLDGLEVCRRVRQANKVLYIILLTARGGKDRLIEGLDAGADDYLMKPFDKDELRARLRVGARIVGLHTALTTRVKQLEAAAFEIQSLKLQLPL